MSEMNDMKVTAIAPWFGGKRTMAPIIIAELGPHAAYWEPFCGSMAVLLAKPPCPMETVNDLHAHLINLAQVIRHPALGPMLYRRLRRTLASKDLMNQAAKALKNSDRVGGIGELSDAYNYFISSWLGRNGVSGTESYNQGYSRRFTKNGGHAATRWLNVVDSIPAFRRRLRSVSILNEDAFLLIDRIEDAEGVVIYADPPYVEKGAKYFHDFDENDHRRLAATLARFTKTRVVVSYYDHALVRQLYQRWTFVECPTIKALLNQSRRDGNGTTMAPEILIINGASYSQKGGLFS